jgi:predicted esterase
MNYQRKRIPCHTVTDFILSGNQNNDTLYLLLHGFNESGEKIFKRVSPLLHKDALILSPNGNFPLPVKKPDEGYTVNFGWYFFDNSSNTYFIDYDLPSEILINLIKELGLENKKLFIIGYSQGGYLAPFLALKHNNVKKVIAMACVFRHKLFESTPDFPMVAIHGTDDLMVSFEGQKQSVKEMKDKGMKIDFVPLEGAGHRLDDQFKQALKDSLN